MTRVTLIGLGAIASAALPLLRADPALRVDRVVVRPGRVEAARAALAALGCGDVEPVDSMDWAAAGRLTPGHPGRPDLIVECAGHTALETHVLPALAAGMPCAVVSVGALSAPGLAERLEHAARAGGTQVHLLAGAIGAIDALAAARIGGLDAVRYTGRKPPRAWRGTPAEEVCDLGAVQQATPIFEGTAREAAARFPKNANVAATIALAGLGLDATRVTLVADPGVDQNVHELQAEGAFGSLALTMRGKPLAANPKTSALTVFSVVRAVRQHAHALVI
jgi:aspartate dehydrogenase